MLSIECSVCALYRTIGEICRQIAERAAIDGAAPSVLPLIVIALGAFALAAVAHEYLYARFRAPEIEAFALNLIMSALFCARLADHPDPSAPTLAIALLKAAGTGAISLANLIDGAAWSPRRRPLLFLIPAILLLDAIYIAALW